MQEPDKGFYYHYKHDENGDMGNYTYEVLNMGHHTEIEGWNKNALVIYRPLYESSVYKLGKHWDARPLKMFLEPVMKDGKEVPRFRKITDPEIISKLEKIRDDMYRE